MDTLLMKCYMSLNSQKLLNGKELMLQTVMLPDDAQTIYLEHTCYKEIEIISNDRFGLEIKLEIFKKTGSITIFLHKKRKKFINIVFSDAFGKEIFISRNDTHNFSLFEESLLTEFPSFMREFFKQMTSKWKTLSLFCVQVSMCHKKNFNVYIHIKANKNKKFIYNLDENSI